jgi:predicted enzyme related to lactoylglutathione lyase
MGERTTHAAGTPSWCDLATSDRDDAKRFYTELMGWEVDDRPIPGDGVYTMLIKDGKEAAALSQAPPGVPPFWNSYVTVDSADESAARAKELGGAAVMEPFDVMEAGRMATLQDPTGAVFSVWQPGDSIGAQVVNVPGALTLTQLNTSDPAKATEFYTALFGWGSSLFEGGPEPYWALTLGDRNIAGLMQLPAEAAGAPSHWLIYFGSEDVAPAAGRIGELGGQVVIPPLEVPGGKIVVAQDPQGATFGLFSGEFDD